MIDHNGRRVRNNIEALQRRQEQGLNRGRRLGMMPTVAPIRNEEPIDWDRIITGVIRDNGQNPVNGRGLTGTTTTFRTTAAAGTQTLNTAIGRGFQAEDVIQFTTHIAPMGATFDQVEPMNTVGIGNTPRFPRPPDNPQTALQRAVNREQRKLVKKSRERTAKITLRFKTIMAWGRPYTGRVYKYEVDKNSELGIWSVHHIPVARVDLKTMKLTEISLPSAVNDQLSNLTRFLWRILGVKALRYKDRTLVTVGEDAEKIGRTLRPGETWKLSPGSVASFFNLGNEMKQIPFAADATWGFGQENVFKLTGGLKPVKWTNIQGENIEYAGDNIYGILPINQSRAISATCPEGDDPVEFRIRRPQIPGNGTGNGDSRDSGSLQAEVGLSTGNTEVFFNGGDRRSTVVHNIWSRDTETGNQL